MASRLLSDVGARILAPFFLATTKSGARSMTLSADGASERPVDGSHSIIECIIAEWTFKYRNGYTVALRGPLTCNVTVVPPSASEHTPALHSLKFDKILFDANVHNKLVALGAIKGDGIYSSEAPQLPIATTMDTRQEEEEEEEEDIPGDPVNAFGIPQASLRCLEVHLRFFLPSHLARLTAWCYSWHNI